MIVTSCPGPVPWEGQITAWHYWRPRATSCAGRIASARRRRSPVALRFAPWAAFPRASPDLELERCVCFSKPASQPATSHRRTRSAFAFAARDEGSEGRARKKQRTKKTVCQAGDDPSNPLGGYPVPTERTPGMNPQSITRIVHHTSRPPLAEHTLNWIRPPKKGTEPRCVRAPESRMHLQILGKETAHGVEGIWQSRFMLLLFFSSVDSPSVRAADAVRRQELEGSPVCHWLQLCLSCVLCIRGWGRMLTFGSKPMPMPMHNFWAVRRFDDTELPVGRHERQAVNCWSYGNSNALQRYLAARAETDTMPRQPTRIRIERRMGKLLIRWSDSALRH